MFVTPPARFGREKVVQRLKQVGVATRSCLKNGYPRGGMGDEDREESVSAARAKGGDLSGDVGRNRV